MPNKYANSSFQIEIPSQAENLQLPDPSLLNILDYWRR